MIDLGLIVGVTIVTGQNRFRILMIIKSPAQAFAPMTLDTLHGCFYMIRFVFWLVLVGEIMALITTLKI